MRTISTRPRRGAELGIETGITRRVRRSSRNVSTTALLLGSAATRRCSDSSSAGICAVCRVGYTTSRAKTPARRALALGGCHRGGPHWQGQAASSADGCLRGNPLGLSDQVPAHVAFSPMARAAAEGWADVDRAQAHPATRDRRGGADQRPRDPGPAKPGARRRDAAAAEKAASHDPGRSVASIAGRPTAAPGWMQPTLRALASTTFPSLAQRRSLSFWRSDEIRGQTRCEPVCAYVDLPAGAFPIPRVASK